MLCATAVLLARPRPAGPATAAHCQAAVGTRGARHAAAVWQHWQELHKGGAHMRVPGTRVHSAVCSSTRDGSARRGRGHEELARCRAVREQVESEAVAEREGAAKVRRGRDVGGRREYPAHAVVEGEVLEAREEQQQRRGPGWALLIVGVAVAVPHAQPARARVG
eukprot:2632778-Rhodomonas_salina.1